MFKNLVNIGPVTVEFKRVESRIFDAICHCPSFGMLAFQNILEYRNFDFSLLIGSHFGTLCWNFVRFRLVTPELKT